MTTLIVMRLADMKRIHPEMTTNSMCCKCGHRVGIYPSGQRIIASDPTTEIICGRCRDPRSAQAFAPGAEFEPFESVRKL